MDSVVSTGCFLRPGSLASQLDISQGLLSIKPFRLLDVKFIQFQGTRASYPQRSHERASVCLKGLTYQRRGHTEFLAVDL